MVFARSYLFHNRRGGAIEKDHPVARRNRSPVSPSLLLVPVEPSPDEGCLASAATRLEAAFGRVVRVTEPVTLPASARLAPYRSAPDPIRAAIAATWGCGCRDRLVGVTAASLDGAAIAPGRGCGDVLVLTLSCGADVAALVREVGRSLGLGECVEPGCAMHPGGAGAGLCRACRSRC